MGTLGGAPRLSTQFKRDQTCIYSFEMSARVLTAIVLIVWQSSKKGL